MKEIMMDNIEKVLDRGEKIELLVDKTENLRSRRTTSTARGARPPAHVVAKPEDEARVRVVRAPSS